MLLEINFKKFLGERILRAYSYAGCWLLFAAIAVLGDPRY